MALLRGWMVGIIGGAILSSFAQSLMPEGGVKQVGKLVCGLVLAAAVLQPLSDPAQPVWRTDMMGEDVIHIRAQQLQNQTGNYMRAVIEEELTAYSMDKAAQLGIDCRVQVTCAPGEEGVFLPKQVLICGVSEEESLSLVSALQQDLGLKTEQIHIQEGEQP